MKPWILIFVLVSATAAANANVLLIKTSEELKNENGCQYELLNPNSGADIYKVICPQGKRQLLRRFKKLPQEKNLNWRAFENNDPNSQEQWSLDVSHVQSYWAKMKSTSMNPLIAIIDTGIDYRHEDLMNSIAYNTSEIPGNGVDDDQNGYVDDYIGWNALENSSTPADDHFHGTAIAGLINAKTNNEAGIAGFLLQNSIVPVKFLSPKGGNTDVAIKAIDYAISRNVKILSLSWGGPKPSPLLEEMLKRCRERGILVVAAAGNESTDNDKTPSYPANYELDNILSVASLNWRGELADHSNFGKTSVDIAAPGESVMATIPNHRYGYMTGTSYAVPHIAAALSMIWSQNPTWTYLEVKNYLLSRCRVEASFKGKISCQGYLDFELL